MVLAPLTIAPSCRFWKMALIRAFISTPLFDQKVLSSDATVASIRCCGKRSYETGVFLPVVLSDSKRSLLFLSHIFTLPCFSIFGVVQKKRNIIKNKNRAKTNLM